MNEVLLKSVVPSIGNILKVFREKTRKKQGEVATKAGISISMLSQIERGVVSPSIDTLFCVCKAVGMDIADLFRRISPDAPVRLHAGRTAAEHATSRRSLRAACRLGARQLSGGNVYARS